MQTGLTPQSSHAWNSNQHLAPRSIPAQLALARFHLARGSPGVPRVCDFSRDDSASKHAEHGSFRADGQAELGAARIHTSRASADGSASLGTAIIRIRWERIAGSQ